MFTSTSSLLLLFALTAVATPAALCGPLAEDQSADEAKPSQLNATEQLNIWRKSSSVSSNDIKLMLDLIRLMAEYSARQEAAKKERDNSQRQDEPPAGGGGPLPDPQIDTQFIVQIVFLLARPLLEGLTRVPLLGRVVGVVYEILDGLARDKPADQIPLVG